MGMRENPSSGYVLEVIKLQRFLGNESVRLVELVEDGDWESVQDLLEKHLPPEIPKPTECFTADDDFAGEDLEKGTMYACFAESDLFTKIETPGMEALKGKGIKPIFASWTVFA